MFVTVALRCLDPLNVCYDLNTPSIKTVPEGGGACLTRI